MHAFAFICLAAAAPSHALLDARRVLRGRVGRNHDIASRRLDEVFPENSLSPSDPAERALMRKWMRYIEEVPTAAVRFPSFNMAFLPRFDGLDEDQFIEQQADVRPLRK